MKQFLTLFALCLLISSTATAGNDKISVYEIRALFTKANVELASPNILIGKSFLLQKVAENAVFETNFENYRFAYGYYDHPYASMVDYNVNPYYYGYRYPYHARPYLKATSMSRAEKNDILRSFEVKKNLIAGYRPEYKITGIKIRPDAESAVVDVDMREYGYQYAPSSVTLTDAKLHSKSKCKVYLTKRFGDVYITRRDCNTVTNLPQWK